MTSLNAVWAVACGLLLLAGGDKPEFKEFQSNDGGFKVQMPGTPKEATREASGISITTYTVEGSEGAYLASFCVPMIPAGETAEQIQDRLDGARDGMLRNIDGTLKREKKITLSGKYPGREMQAELPEMKGLVYARVYIVDGVLYQVVAAGTKSWIESPDVDKFLDSFALTK